MYIYIYIYIIIIIYQEYCCDVKNICLYILCLYEKMSDDNPEKEPMRERLGKLDSEIYINI